MNKKLAIIPARGGSKRIKNKNIKRFYDEPIILKVYKQVLKSGIFKKIHISTDSLKIKNLLKKNNIKIDFMRPSAISTDHSVINDVITFVLKEYRKINVYFDEVWIIFPTSVLISFSDLREASILFSSKNAKSIMSVSKFPAPIEWAYKIKNNKLVPVNKNKLSKPSFSFDEHYFETASFYGINLNKVPLSNISKLTNHLPFILPPHKSVDIDNKEDWELAKKFFKFK